MWNFIKSVIVISLFLGVIYLGYKLYCTATEVAKNPLSKPNEISETIDKAAKDAVEKAAAGMESMLKAAKENAPKQSEESTPQKLKPAAAAKPEAEPAAREKSPRVAMNPMDEEDRKLTAEVLAKGATRQESSKAADAETANAKSAGLGVDQAQAGSSSNGWDFNRMAKIREIYSNAIDTLNMK